MRHWLQIVAWNLVLLSIFLVLMDAGLRWTRFDEARRLAIVDPPGYYISDSELGTTLAKNAAVQTFRFRGPPHDISTNAIGCFDKPVQLKPGQPYILAIGDSFTWGYAPLEMKWTSHLERRTGLRVVKCGVSGTGTWHQLARLKRLVSRLPHPPALVIHLYDTTDFNDDFTFPAYTLVANQRIENFASLRLADGHREPLTAKRRKEIEEKIRGRNRGFLERYSTLYNVAKMGLEVDSRVERRRLITEGRQETHLKGKYDFNLQLLDDKKYPFVAKQFDAHIDRIRQMRDYVHSQGGRYAMFHTNSFRLPDNRPLVRRLKTFLDGFEPFLGWIPELAKYQFDPHWTVESNKEVAAFLLERLSEEGYLPLTASVTAR